ncbi:MAG: hypothetical protein NUV31_01235, partial [Dehalococcoidales bacterium]|nr:hypothetical protein [Dehalococcoidales bacterium]
MWNKWRNYLVFFLVIPVIILTLVLSACSSPTTSAPTTSSPTTSTPATTSPVAAKTVELKLAHAWAPTHLMHIVIQKWADDVYKATDGRVKITIYPGGALSTAAQLYDT